MKRVVLQVILCGALCALVLSCASTGGGKQSSGLGKGILAVGAWDSQDDSSDGGVSTVTLTELVVDGKPAVNYAGYFGAVDEGGLQWSYLNFIFDPDDATIEAFKNAKGVSFWVKGDGGDYRIAYMIDSVTDYGYHLFPFVAPEQATYVEVPMDYFMQPSWGTYRALDQSRFEAVRFSTDDSMRGNDYDLTIWDFQVYR